MSHGNIWQKLCWSVHSVGQKVNLLPVENPARSRKNFLKCYSDLLNFPLWCIAATGVPVAVPGVRLADGVAAVHTDRGHSLASFLPPPAALPSLPIKG